MNDRKWIIAGLVVFFGLFTFPFWCNLAVGNTRPPQIKTGKGKCVEPADFMRRSHMRLLHKWRDQAVRRGERIYVAADGVRHEISLTRTCLRCHPKKSEFCDQCHDYADVRPSCWHCHVAPKEAK